MITNGQFSKKVVLLFFYFKILFYIYNVINNDMELIHDFKKVNISIDGTKSTAYIYNHKDGSPSYTFQHGREVVKVYLRSDGMYEIHSEWYPSKFNDSLQNLTNPSIISLVMDKYVHTNKIEKKSGSS